MRFLSRYGRFGVQIRPLITENYATGLSSVTQEPLYAIFQEGDLRPEERELAFATWTWNGFYQEQDEVTVVQPDYRIGVFDSEKAQIANGWSDADRQYIEAELSALAERGNDICIVPRTVLSPPWPRYDQFAGTPDALIARLIEDGHDLEKTLAYEREMQNRLEVVDALVAAVDGTFGDGLVDYDPDEETIVG